MGLRDWLRGKPEQDPILGGLGQEPTGLEVEASSSTVFGSGAEGIDPAELTRRLQAAGGDPEQLVAQLREMFPGAEISASESTVVDAGSSPSWRLSCSTRSGWASRTRSPSSSASPRCTRAAR